MSAGGEKGDAPPAAEQPLHLVGDAGVRVEHHVDRDIIKAADESDEAVRDAGQALAPAFPAMACDEQPPLAALILNGATQWNPLEQGVEAGVAGDVDGTGQTLAPEVRRIQPRGSEQQIGQAIDGDAKVFLGPWTRPGRFTLCPPSSAAIDPG